MAQKITPHQGGKAKNFNQSLGGGANFFDQIPLPGRATWGKELHGAILYFAKFSPAVHNSILFVPKFLPVVAFEHQKQH